jgi:hypothetical protein
MDSAIQVLVRRGAEAHLAFTSGKTYEMPAWGMSLLIGTLLVFGAGMFMVEYTFGHVVTTLIMVESPQSMVFETVASEDPDAVLEDKKVETELMLVKQAPITSSFRATLRHLRATAGRRAGLRGLSMHVFFVFALAIAQSMLAQLGVIPTLAVPVIAAVLCAPLMTAWTLIVISEPSNKRFYQRIPSLKTWKKVAGPTAVLALTKELTVFLPTYLGMAYGLDKLDPEEVSKLSKCAQSAIFFKGVALVALSLMLAIALIVPAKVTLTRVQASLLADNEETIVPFDRSFGGKFVSEIEGGKGVIGMLDAWKTFDMAARWRLMKAYVKVFGIHMALMFVFLTTIVCEVVFITGGDVRKLIPDTGDNATVTVV